MARPILASAIGGLVEVVAPEETGWLVRPGDPAAWAAALARAADIAPDRLSAMGAAGRARVEARYSLGVMTGATLDAYARILERRG
jgi:glycosyltransferase involved in cell wall biosynthesis